MTDPAWLKDFLAAPPPGVEPLTEDEAEEMASYVGQEGYVAVAFEEVLRSVEDYRLVASGPQAVVSGEPFETWIWVEREAPEQLYLSLTLNLPPLLWCEAGRTRESFEETLSGYSASSATAPGAEKTWRCFLGTANDIAELEDTLLIGGGYINPLPVTLGTANMAESYSPDVTTVMDTVFSGSRLVVSAVASILPGTRVVSVTVTYAPQKQSAAIERYNQAFSADLPADCPVDVAAALTFGDPPFGAKALHRFARQEPLTRNPAWIMVGLAAIHRDDVEGVLAPYAEDSRDLVRQAAIATSWMCGVDGLMKRAAAEDPNSELREWARSHFEEG